MMQKISGILPSNNRITSVDLTDAPPVRAGAPSLGRRIVASSVERPKIEVDVLQVSENVNSPMNYGKDGKVEASQITNTGAKSLFTRDDFRSLNENDLGVDIYA